MFCLGRRLPPLRARVCVLLGLPFNAEELEFKPPAGPAGRGATWGRHHLGPALPARFRQYYRACAPACDLCWIDRRRVLIGSLPAALCAEIGALGADECNGKQDGAVDAAGVPGARRRHTHRGRWALDVLGRGHRSQLLRGQQRREPDQIADRSGFPLLVSSNHVLVQRHPASFRIPNTLPV